MANSYFRFKQFTVWHDRCAMKVGTDSVLLGAWVNTEGANKILDIGSGSGIISIMLAQRCNAEIFGVEIEPNAYEQSLENISKTEWTDRIQMIQDSIQNYSIRTTSKFDCIVTNPPYFYKSLQAGNAERTLARHNSGLPFTELLQAVTRLLTDNGYFYIILPLSLASFFITEAMLFHLYVRDRLKVRPISYKEANRVILQFSKLRQNISEKELIISGDDGKESSAFKELTAAFYLKF